MRGWRGILFGGALALLATVPLKGARGAPETETPRTAIYLHDCGREDPSVAANAPPIPRKLRESSWATPHGPVVRRPFGPWGNHARGALTGKTVYLSAGHGWVYYLDAWHTQRGNTHGLVEDLSNAEAVDLFLVDSLRRLGARVVPVREADLNPNLVLLDDEEAIFSGDTAPSPSTAAGFGHVTLPITSDAVNPFTAGGTQYLPASATETARALYPLDIPSSGAYHVYVSYAQGANRVSDAHYLVRHAAGESRFLVDQRRHGATWVLLGRYYFEAGAPPERASVVVTNESQDPDAVVSLDAVRLGGGAGLVDRGGGANSRPMYEHAARYAAQLNGAPTEVFLYTTSDRSDDVGTRSRFAAWDHEDGEDAVYVSWHTNAPDPGLGTSSYTYGPGAPPSPLSEFSGVQGSLELQQAVHEQLVGDLQAAWDPDWTDRGQHTADFGELNPTHNPETPAVLLEIAFHDTPADAAALKEPGFRHVAARAVARGVARYFAERDGTPLVLAPDPPSALRIENDGTGGLRVSWRPPAPAAAAGDPPEWYRVYLSRDGHAFDDGTLVDGESLVVGGLVAGDVRYARVAAVNAGGESPPTEVVGACSGAAGYAPVLVVGGFDRLDAAMLPTEDLSSFGLGEVVRMWLSRMNDGSYASRHGAAVVGAGYSFDGATDEAIAQGDLDLGAYRAVDWFLGRESLATEIFDEESRTAVERLLAAGGALFVTGAELARALGGDGTEAEQLFLSSVLHTTYQGDDAATVQLSAPTDEGPFAGLAPLAIDDPEVYDAALPDLLEPSADALAALFYDGGPGVAAVAFIDPATGGAGIACGFPFETIRGSEVREEVMGRALSFFGVTEPHAPDGGLPSGDAGRRSDGDVTDDGGTDKPGEVGSCACRTTAPGAPDTCWVLLIIVAVGAQARRRRAPRRRHQAPSARRPHIAPAERRRQCTPLQRRGS